MMKELKIPAKLVKNDEKARAWTVCHEQSVHLSLDASGTHEVFGQPGAHEAVVEVPAVSWPASVTLKCHLRDEERREEQHDSPRTEQLEDRLEFGLPRRLLVRRDSSAVLSPN
jgi:hypothetical protein